MDDNTLAQRKIYWIASLFVTTFIFLLTISYRIIFPGLRIIIYYGLFLTVIFIQGVILPLIMRRGVSIWHMFIDQTLVALATLLCILKLGGIPYSGGLVIVGLGLVFFSLNHKKKSHSIAIFLINAVTILLAGILHPYLEVPPEMTPAVNVSLFVVNLLWVSGFALIFVLNFISMRVRIEQSEAKRLKEMDEAKTRLYTNITHEFRTPLTIINGMVDLMRNDPEKWLKEGCNTIERNTANLLHLINQMLELSKLEAGALHVRMIRGDIQRYINYIVELFRSVAQGKDIKLEYYPGAHDLKMDYEPEKLMIILSNLISNALKYTNPGGMVEVGTILKGKNKDVFKLRVSDNGHGISKNHLPYIFERFYRIEEGSMQNAPGSGLGLALTKELVHLLGGNIRAQSKPGQGTKFIVSLPVSFIAPPEEERDLHDLKGWMLSFIPSYEPRSDFSKVSDFHMDDRPLLLIVEDNHEVIQYLRTLLEMKYDIVVALNGQEGLNKAVEFIPDIILTDIMMPVMDGIQMLKQVKSDLRTSHIPVVVLTAKADVASRLEGLERGADAYIPKPFQKEELIVQLRTLIDLRKKLRERYAVLGFSHQPDEKDFHREDVFMHKVRESMLTHLSDESFDIHKLCDEMAMSRTQLYRKFKSLTDNTIQEYLKSLRLHRAKELLTTTNITVSEAAYRTGFKNLSHFSRAFTLEFSTNPSEIQK
ncbi:MAG: response regulator [Bacteroidales bacterium]|nr:response regulator [Bacteroidales bacterium]